MEQHTFHYFNPLIKIIEIEDIGGIFKYRQPK